MATIPTKVIERFKENLPKLQKVVEQAKNKDINEADTVTIVSVCSYPDLHTLQSTGNPLYSRFSHISQMQIDNILGENLKIPSDKERKYWENTASLFSRMGILAN